MNSAIFYVIKQSNQEASQIQIRAKQDSFSDCEPEFLNSGRIFSTPDQAQTYIEEGIKRREKYIHQGNYEENLKELESFKLSKVIPLTLNLTIGEPL